MNPLAINEKGAKLKMSFAPFREGPFLYRFSG